MENFTKYYPQWVSIYQGEIVNKADLVDVVAGAGDLSKAAAGRTLDALLSAISGALSGGGTVTITGFGTFSVSNRAARMGRNPQTGEAIHIAASIVWLAEGLNSFLMGSGWEYGFNHHLFRSGSSVG